MSETMKSLEFCTRVWFPGHRLDTLCSSIAAGQWEHLLQSGSGRAGFCLWWLWETGQYLIWHGACQGKIILTAIWEPI